VITDELFIWQGTPVKSFVVDDLRHVGVVRAGQEPISPIAVLTVAAGTVTAIGAGWTLLDPPAAYAIGLLAVLVPVSFAVPAMARRRPRGWELHALYRGVDVVLYASFDERQFNQVKRALRRAIENARPPDRGFNLAAA
jgi:hypothetical protein